MREKREREGESDAKMGGWAFMEFYVCVVVAEDLCNSARRKEGPFASHLWRVGRGGNGVLVFRFTSGEGRPPSLTLCLCLLVLWIRRVVHIKRTRRKFVVCRRRRCNSSSRLNDGFIASVPLNAEQVQQGLGAGVRNAMHQTALRALRAMPSDKCQAQVLWTRRKHARAREAAVAVDGETWVALVAPLPCLRRAPYHDGGSCTSRQRRRC